MGAFEEIVSQLRRDPFTFTPEGNGYWSNGLPCVTCGSISVVLDPVPACVVCTDRIESMHVDIEHLSRRLDALNLLAPLLPTEAKRQLRHQAHVWAVHLHKLLVATADES